LRSLDRRSMGLFSLLSSIELFARSLSALSLDFSNTAGNERSHLSIYPHLPRAELRLGGPAQEVGGLLLGPARAHPRRRRLRDLLPLVGGPGVESLLEPGKGLGYGCRERWVGHALDAFFFRKGGRRREKGRERGKAKKVKIFLKERKEILELGTRSELSTIRKLSTRASLFLSHALVSPRFHPRSA